MEKVFKDRLKKLEAFLRKLKKDQFYFMNWVEQFAEDETGALCGTVCCAVGWCPKVFPSDWEWAKVNSDFAVPKLKASEMKQRTSQDAMHFFGLTSDEEGGLFHTGYQRPWAKGELNGRVSPTKVANGIRDFILWKERQA